MYANVINVKVTCDGPIDRVILVCRLDWKYTHLESVEQK